MQLGVVVVVLEFLWLCSVVIYSLIDTNKFGYVTGAMNRLSLAKDGLTVKFSKGDL